MLTHVLIVSTGVATAVPLLFFAGAVKRLRLTTIGLIQYMAPTIQFLLGVFVYQEPFDSTKLIGFVLIWSGLILYSVEGLYRAQRTRKNT
jgi:chloramphenicol-sensitive protein RarD